MSVKMITCSDLEREFFKHISPTESRSSTPIPKQKLEDERAARTNIQLVLSSLSMPPNNNSHPSKAEMNSSDEQMNDEGYGTRLSLIAIMYRQKVENDRKLLFSNIFEGPYSNRGKVRMN